MRWVRHQWRASRRRLWSRGRNRRGVRHRWMAGRRRRWSRGGNRRRAFRKYLSRRCCQNRPPKGSSVSESVSVNNSQTCYVTGPFGEVGFDRFDRVQVGRIRSIGLLICFLSRLTCFRTSVLVYKLGDMSVDSPMPFPWRDHHRSVAVGKR